jgi:Phosphoesterase family
VANSNVERLNLVPFSHFAADLNNNQLPNFSFVVPNAQNDAHDCPAGTTSCTDAQKLTAADAWLKNNIAPLLNNAAFQKDGILVIVFDEAATTDVAHGGGHVAAVVVGPHVKKGAQSSVFYQHQNLLKTVLEALGAKDFPGAAAKAHPMTDMFVGNTPQPPPPVPGGCPATGIGITICSPASAATVSSPVKFSVAAHSTHRITAMRLYVDGVARMTVGASHIDAAVPMSKSRHWIVVQAWDATGAVFRKAETITVK